MKQTEDERKSLTQSCCSTIRHVPNVARLCNTRQKLLKIQDRRSDRDQNADISIPELTALWHLPVVVLVPHTYELQTLVRFFVATSRVTFKCGKSSPGSREPELSPPDRKAVLALLTVPDTYGDVSLQISSMARRTFDSEKYSLCSAQSGHRTSCNS